MSREPPSNANSIGPTNNFSQIEQPEAELLMTEQISSSRSKGGGNIVMASSQGRVYCPNVPSQAFNKFLF